MNYQSGDLGVSDQYTIIDDVRNDIHGQDELINNDGDYTVTLAQAGKLFLFRPSQSFFLHLNYDTVRGDIPVTTMVLKGLKAGDYIVSAGADIMITSQLTVSVVSKS